MKEKGKLKAFSLMLTWILFVSSVAFVLSYFPAQLPFFKIKRITVEGNRYVDFETIRKAIEDLSMNIADLGEERILKELNTRTGGRIKKVLVTRRYTLEGIEINLKVEERIPKAKLKVGSSFLLIDEEGVMFPKAEREDIRELPTVETYTLDLPADSMSLLLKELEESGISWDRMIIKRNKIVLKSGKLTVILPPLKNLHPTLSDRLNMIYNFQGKMVDLRYERFILVKE